MIILTIFVLHWYGSLFFQSFFHHRYAAHQQFTMSKFWERFFFIGAYISMGSHYLSPYVYGVLHRQHHAFTDTPEDPHSPKYDGNLFKMMLKTRQVYNAIDFKQIIPEKRFTINLPKWEGFDKFASSRFSRLSWIAAYVAFYVSMYFIFHFSAWLFLLIPVHILLGPVHGVIINWFAHKYGYINFKLKNTSKNLMPFDIFMWGEGFHNNHHKYSGRSNFGVKWYEFDPMYPIIWVMDKLHIIRLARVAA